MSKGETMDLAAISDSPPAMLIPARKGVAVRVPTGKTVKIVNTHGKQVIDTWAFNEKDPREFMSMEHSHTSMLKLNPALGDQLVSNRRRPMLTMVEDTSPGIHDTLVAACDCHRYRQLGIVGHHDNCAENLDRALRSVGIEPPDTPAPLNLFMNVSVSADGGLAFLAPVSAAGQYVSFTAEMDLVVVLSACPQDVTPVNGLMPTDAHYLVE
jgi:uncharacterized protein